MTSVLRILTTASLDSSPTIILTAPDGSRILVDCGEGCQRTLLEQQQRVSTLRAVCLTGLSAAELAGLPGMILTAADVQATVATAEAVHRAQRKNAAANGASASSSSHQSSLEATSATANTTMNEKSRRQGELLAAKDTAPFTEEAATTKNGSSAPSTTAGILVLGPPGTQAFLHSLRHFMRRSRFPITVHEGGVIADGLSVETMTQQQQQQPQVAAAGSKRKRRPPTDDRVSFRIQSFSYHDEHQDHDHCTDNDKSSASTTTSIPTATYSYAFYTPPLVGKFMADRAAALGVPRGPLLGRLKAGESVTFTNASTGKTVTIESSQVVMPNNPGIAVLVLKYPSHLPLDRLQHFFESTRIATWLDEHTHDLALEVVVHVATSQAFNDPASLTWRHKLSNNNNAASAAALQHIFVDADPLHDQHGTPHRSAAIMANTRAALCPDIYRPIVIPSLDVANKDDDDDDDGKNGRDYVTARPSLEYQLLPRSRRGFVQYCRAANGGSSHGSAISADDAPLCSLDISSQQLDQAQSLAKKILSTCGNTSNNDGIHCGELVFTGTASAIPCKYRNVTGMCLTQPDGRSLLLDVGEGTVGQLLRLQSATSPDVDVLGRIKAVWISHPHADHHLGILRLLQERRAPDPILLMAPRPIFDFLRDYAAATHQSQLTNRYRALDCRDLQRPSPCVTRMVQESFGITGVLAVQVQHCPYSYAVVLDGTCFGRLAYSGDCRPSADFAQAGVNANVLIHEATFEDGMEAEAVLKRHSTVGEALQVAHDMRAQCTVLTHFSQRYPKIPPMPSAASQRFHDGHDRLVIFAFDHMRLTPTTLATAARLTPALRLLDPDDETDSQLDKDAKKTAEAALSVPGLFAQGNLL